MGGSVGGCGSQLDLQLMLNLGLEGFSPQGKPLIGESILNEEEAVLAVVTALGDVLRDADQVEPAWSGHDMTPGLKP